MLGNECQVHKLMRSLIQRGKAKVLVLASIDDKVKIFDDKRLVSLAKNNQVKVEDVIKDMILEDQSKDFEYDEVTTNFVSLPRTSVKIHSDSWTKITAKEALKKYMTIFNLGRGMLIRYYAKVEPDTYFEQRNNNDDVVSSEDK